MPLFLGGATDISTWPIAAVVGTAVGIVALLGIVFRAGGWTSGVNDDRTNFKAFMEEIRKDIKDILTRLPPAPVTSSSPLRLTEFGERIAKWMDAEAWATRVAPDLTSQLLFSEPFEVDEGAEEYVKSELDAEYRSRVPECTYEFGIEQEDVLAVLRIVLRDELLKKVADGRG